MRFCIVSVAFPPEPITSAFTSGDLADGLANRGHEVVVIAPFPNRPAGRLLDGYRRAWRHVETRNATKVVHTWHTMSGKSTFQSRGLENVSFGLTSAIELGRLLRSSARPQLVYANTWPIVAQQLVARIVLAGQARLVTSVQDVYPESLSGKGMLAPEGAVARMMMAMDRFVLGRSSRVVTISELTRRHLIETRSLDPERVKVVPNWLDESRFVGAAPDRDLRRRLGIRENHFVAMFAGSLTMSAGVGLYLNTAKLLGEHPDVQLVLAGDGSMRDWLQAEIRRSGLRNIKVLCPLPQSAVAATQAAADVLMLSLVGETGQTALPSKLVAYMLSGKAIIASVADGSAPALALRDANAGYVVAPEDASALASKLIECRTKGEQLARLGANAREYALCQFSKTACLARLVLIMEEAVTEAAPRFGRGAAQCDIG